MTETISETKVTKTETSREFAIGIHRDKKGFLVRKSEIMHGVRVPIDETYVLDLPAAIWMQQYWCNELNKINLN
jgi:hypothetical protein